MQPGPSGPFKYAPLPKRPILNWPDGARVAVWVVMNMEYFPLDQPVPGGSGLVPDIVQWSKRDYGNRVGFWRCRDVLDRLEFPVTANVNVDICDPHPEVIEAAKESGWEFMAHGESNARPLNRIAPDEERAVIKRAFDKLEEVTGTRPVGWMGPGMHETWNTLDYLAEEKVLYCADWINDDQPYLMHAGNHQIVSVPYGEHPHDKGAFERYHYSPVEFEQMIRDAFDVLYEDGATTGMVLPIAVHPFISGPAYRIKALGRALEYINGFDRVWKTTGAGIARAYLDSGAAI